MANDVYFLVCFFSICMFSLVRYPFRSFDHFKIGLFAALLLHLEVLFIF